MLKKKQQGAIFFYLLPCFFLIILNAQAYNIYTNFLFVNTSKTYTLKVDPGHSRCINPDRDRHKKTTIYPHSPPKSYWSDSIKSSCAGIGSTFVTWYLSAYKGDKQLCSVALEFDYDDIFKTRCIIKHIKKLNNGNITRCRSIRIKYPMQLKSTRKNEITIIFIPKH